MSAGAGEGDGAADRAALSDPAVVPVAAGASGAIDAPVQPGDRVGLLDALRGFALFGVCLSNLLAGFAFWGDPAAEGLVRFALPTDGAAEFLIRALVEGKFYSIFSLLFGVGFALALRGDDSRLGRYRRRIHGLLIIGAAHLLLLWPGDILFFYALMALVLVRLRGLDDRRMLRLAAIFVLVPIALYLPVMIHWALHLGMPFMAAAFGTGALVGIDVNQESLLFHVYSRGDIGELLRLNLVGFWFRLGDLLFVARPFKVLAMFLVGFVVGRQRLWARLDEVAPVLRKVAAWGIGGGFPLSVAWALVKSPEEYFSGTWNGLLETILYSLSVAPLALGYAAAFALLWRRAAAARVLGAFAPAGRMALTNYLSQTVIALLLFTGVGLALVGRVGPTLLWALAISILAAQILASALWLRFFRFGPMEWLWRSWTYRGWQPLRRSA